MAKTQPLEIILLKDNFAAAPGVCSGHGLAMLLQCGHTRVLFDTGPDGSLLANAAALGVSLRPLTAIVLSHGHFDHTGGLEAVLVHCGPVRVVAHPDIFAARFSGPDPHNARPIGMRLSREAYETLGARFALSELPVEIAPGLFTTGQIPLVRPLLNAVSAALWRQEDGQILHDSFRDDCALVACLSDGSVVLTGCAHVGLPNILYKAVTIAPNHPPRLVIGGLHLMSAPRGEIEQIAQEAAALGVRVLMPCHCTGREATEILRECFAGDVIPIATGSRIVIEPNCRIALVNSGRDLFRP